jgi:hypothetical protein
VSRSTLASWNTTGTPSADSTTSSSIAGMPSAAARRKPASVFSWCSRGTPRCPTTIGRGAPATKAFTRRP